MRKRNPLFSAMMAALVPVPVFAFDSGVRGMEVAETTEQEQMSLQQWAFSELQLLEVGFRSRLEPVFPVPKQEFSVLDAEIATFIADGQREKARIQELIEQLDLAPPAAESEPMAQLSTPQKAEGPTLTTNEIFFYNASESNMEVVPDVTINSEEGFLLDVDTSKGIDLPDITFDPRNGGEYTSEIFLVQEALNLVQLLQDQVPAPIQTAGNELYNKLTGSEDQA